MTQNPLVDLGAQSSKTAQLKPALAAALASLEVKLDQELTRYRRTRTVYRNPSQPRVGSFTSSQLQQLTVLSTKEGKKTAPEEIGRDHQKELEVTVTTAAPSSKQQEELSIPDKANTSSPTLDSQQMTEALKTGDLQIPTPSKTTQVPNSTSISIVPAITQHNNSENTTQPNDFLDSSEALLRSLAQEQANTQNQTSTSNSLLSPLGIGSMLLLLLASLTFGFVIFNPKNLPHFNFKGLLTNETTTKVQNTGEEPDNTQLGHEPQLTPIPKYPNLAQKELPEVRDPNDVVGLKPKPKEISIPTPYSAATVNPTTTPYQLQSAPSIKNSPPITTLTTPSPFSEHPLDTQIKRSKDGFYHLLTENQSPQAFTSARKIVPDAYLSADGKYIYLGAVKSKDKAQQLLKQLESKGIKAQFQR
jgi:hypothetical protein